MRSQVLQYVGFIEKRNANRRELFIKKLSNQIQTSFNSGEEYVFNTRSQRLNCHHPVLNEDDYDDKLRKVDEVKPYRYRSHWRSTATTAHGQGGPASRAASLHKHSAPASPNAARRAIVRGSLEDPDGAPDFLLRNSYSGQPTEGQDVPFRPHASASARVGGEAEEGAPAAEPVSPVAPEEGILQVQRLD